MAEVRLQGDRDGRTVGSRDRVNIATQPYDLDCRAYDRILEGIAVGW
jgi:hypothetical protein